MGSLGPDNSLEVLAALDKLQDIPRDEVVRKQLLEKTRSLALKLETSGETMQRLSYIVRLT